MKLPLVTQIVKDLPAMRETQVRPLGREDPLEKGMATHSSILAWRIPGQRSLMGYCPCGLKESDTTEQLSTRVPHPLNLSSWLVPFAAPSTP